MHLYSVLMVDDEEEVIQIIRRKIDWEALGFFVCGQARNGMEALEMVEELQPDVVMTDIKMPYMDGLELSRQLKERYKDIRIIIFSGFDDFDYAKQAIGLEVEDYLLKPIDATEIRKVFEKTKVSLDEARDLKNNLAHLENYYQKSLPILREGFFSSLIENAIPFNSIKDYLEEYQISLTGPYYAISIIHTSLKTMPEGMSPQLFQLSIRQWLEQNLVTEQSCYIFNYGNNIAALTQFSYMDEISRYTDECDRLCKSARKSYQAIVTIGIGKVVDSLKDIPASYKGAREALSYRTIYGAGNAINIMEIDPKSNEVLSFQTRDSIHNLLKQIKMGSEEDLKNVIHHYIHTLSNAKLNMQGFSILLMELLSELYRFMLNNEIDLSVINEQNEDIYSKILQMDSLEEIGSWLLSISKKIRTIIQEERIHKTGSFVRSAKNYIKENFSNPELSIDLVCSELGVSSSYFSTIFKKETGKTFLNYLTEYRMKEAERLLIEENEKKYIIAEKVGYSDPSYFSYVFKKWFGMSPMKYKTQRKQSE